VYLARDLIERQMVDAPVITLAIERGTVVTEGGEQRATVNAWCETNLLPVLVRLDPERMHVTGEDFGRTSDRTVVTVGAIQPNLSVHPAFALEMCNAPFATQRQIVEYVIRHLPHFVHGAFDATGNGAELAEAMSAKFGERVIEQVKINEPWYAEQLPRFKAALEADRFRLIRSADHLVDLSMFRVINGMPKLPSVRKASSDKKLPHRHGDAAISYVMAFYASCLPINSYDGYESPRTRSVQQQSRFTLHAPEEFDAAFTRYGIL
jgi:phage FluMu gp28-like protein